ncbi:response regulator receiver domain-containing protein [Dokdonia sp. Hel_I_63]|uniref:response regulator n=1 Tax=unclassified Dokdonia TaxID=2615033 RepID=UPI00020A6464|nr:MULTISPECIES: response regulator [unclassified Dokdonia]AEE18896.1 response regulator receiver [Dokdonia sp. 4H-3-7-5]TVZ21877.1 response regulator receiver domain-containing protein [Dokdonia sp. Hel_I_63]
MTYKALIVDDSKPITFFNKIILERSSRFSEILVAVNGEEALKILDTEFNPDIIFLDLNMPVMNGWEFLDTYHQRKARNSQIIMLLGTMPSQENQDRLNSYDCIKGVREKMLSNTVLTEIINNTLAVELRS